MSNCSASMDSTQSKLKFDSEEDMDSLYYLCVQGKVCK